MPKSTSKIVIAIIAVAAIAGIIYLGPEKYLNLAFLQEKLSDFEAYRAANPVLSIAIFALVYIVATAASIPGAVFLTLTGGALFGLVTGTLVVSVAATIGATLAFLFSRYLFRDVITQKFGDKLATFEENVKKDGALYLFSLRLAPVFPFFLINLLMGLTPIKTRTYSLVSWIGMLPGTAVFVNAGTQLATLESIQGLLSPKLILSFILIAIFPYLAKFALKLIRKS